MQNPRRSLDISVERVDLNSGDDIIGSVSIPLSQLAQREIRRPAVPPPPTPPTPIAIEEVEPLPEVSTQRRSKRSTMNIQPSSSIVGNRSSQLKRPTFLGFSSKGSVSASDSLSPTPEDTPPATAQPPKAEAAAQPERVVEWSDSWKVYRQRTGDKGDAGELMGEIQLKLTWRHDPAALVGKSAPVSPEENLNELRVTLKQVAKPIKPQFIQEVESSGGASTVGMVRLLLGNNAP